MPKDSSDGRVFTAMTQLSALTAAVCVPVAVAQLGVPATPPAETTEDASLTAQTQPWDRGLEPRWRLRFSPAAYYVAPEGDLTMPGSGTGLSGQMTKITDLNLDSPRISPAGAIEVARDKLTFRVAGFGFWSERETTTPLAGRFGELTLLPGEGIESELDYQNFDATMRYRLFDYADGDLIPIDDAFSGYTVQASLEALAGLRFQRFAAETRVTSPSAGRAGLPAGSPISTDADEIFAEPIIGGRLAFDLWQRMRIGFTATAGYMEFGDRSASSVDLDVNFAFRVIDEAQLLLGYRLFVADLENGDGADRFAFDGSFAGLYVGLHAAF